MTERINKPKVFLSHSSPDKPFIKKLAADLHQCKIDYWLDTEEIRDGRSWLKVIFEDGIPTCDAVIVYLTQNSLHSKMVEKELDATVVEQLTQGGITVLPYVANADLRPQLRGDIRALQCREWNDSNYQVVLPTVIAEIWRSYLERTIDVAVLQERSRRLELELEMTRLKDHYESSVFAPREDQEFQYLLRKLDRKVECTFGLYQKVSEKESKRIGSEECRLSLLRVLLNHLGGGRTTFNERLIGSQLLRELGKDINLPDHPEIIRGHGVGLREGASLELQTYGLVRLTRRQTYDRWESVFEFSDKMYRLKYWLDYNNFSPDSSIDQVVRFDPQEPSDNEETSIDEDGLTARALEADRRITSVRRLNAWKTSGEGIQAATREIEELFSNLERRVDKGNQILQNIKLEFSRNSSESCRVTNGVVILDISWNTPSESVLDSLLRVGVQLKKSTSADSSGPATQDQQLYETEFRVGVKEDLTMFWLHKESYGRDPLSTTGLAEDCWTSLFGYIQRSEEGNL
jgi:hypothetical protein